MAEPTEADREKAMDIMGWTPLAYESFRAAVAEGNPDDVDAMQTVDDIARALADERAKALAPVLALADEFEARAAHHDQKLTECPEGSFVRGFLGGEAEAEDEAARFIRRACGVTE